MRAWIGLSLLAMLTTLAAAEVPLDGYFTASESCPAYQSISRQTNPGNVLVRPGTAYDLIAGNTDRPTHLWIVVPGATPERRWVAVECGTRSTDAEGQVDAPPPPAPAPTYRGTQYVLAVSWQPAFCETAPGKPECRAQAPDSFEARNFTLHGLWPQPRSNVFCNVSAEERQASEAGDWVDLPELSLSAGLRKELDEVMPGTQSGLDRHEWIKHGTCYGTDAEEYYADSLDLMLALNVSEVAELFATRIGRLVSLAEIREAFDQAFGPGAGERVRVACARDGNRTIITELTIGLTGTIDGPDDVAGLIAAASPVEGGCRSGLVDAVGFR